MLATYLHIVILNADIAIVKDLNDGNMKPNGELKHVFEEKDFIITIFG